MANLPSLGTLRECFVQVSENARALMDLRFKHFGTFVALNGLLGVATFQAPSLSLFRSSIAGFATVISILFWLLDFRTSQYLRDEMAAAKEFMKRLGVPGLITKNRRVLLKASHATNILFLTITIGWMSACIYFRCVHFENAEQGATANP